MKKFFTVAVMASTALSAVIPAAAGAFVIGTATIDDPIPTGPTLATEALMEAACDAKAAVHGVTWNGELESFDDGTIIGTPTADGARDIDEDSIEGTGTPVPESVQVAGNPYRNGGSVNMFGLAHVVAAHYPNSEHDFTQNFNWVAEYNFTCHMTETVQLPDLGVHVWTGPEQAGDPAKENCEGDKNPHEYDDRGANCEFVVTIPGGPDEQDRDDEFGSIQQNESGSLDGHETNGGPVAVDLNADPVPDVQVVVCISPTVGSNKRPGQWVAKNGYSGGSFTGPTAGCNTQWYNTGATAGVTNLNTNGNSYNTTVPYP